MALSQKSPLRFGRRTGQDVLKDKIIRKDEGGGDRYEDYWTDSDDDKSSFYSKSSHRTIDSKKSGEVDNPYESDSDDGDNEEIETSNQLDKAKKSKQSDKFSKSLVSSVFDEDGANSEDIPASKVSRNKQVFLKKQHNLKEKNSSVVKSPLNKTVQDQDKFSGTKIKSKLNKSESQKSRAINMSRNSKKMSVSKDSEIFSPHGKAKSLRNTAVLNAASNSNQMSNLRISKPLEALNFNYAEQSEPTAVDSVCSLSFNKSRRVISPEQVSKNPLSDFINERVLHGKRFEVLKSTSSQLSKTVNKTKNLSPRTSTRNLSHNLNKHFEASPSSKSKELSISQVFAAHKDSNAVKQIYKSKLRSTRDAEMEKCDEYDAIIMQKMNESNNRKLPEDNIANRNTSALVQSSVLHSNKKSHSKGTTDEDNTLNEANQTRIVHKNMDINIPKHFTESVEETSRNVSSPGLPFKSNSGLVKSRKFSFSRGIRETSKAVVSSVSPNILSSKGKLTSPLKSPVRAEQIDDENRSEDGNHENISSPEKSNKKQKVAKRRDENIHENFVNKSNKIRSKQFVKEGRNEIIHKSQDESYQSKDSSLKDISPKRNLPINPLSPNQYNATYSMNSLERSKQIESSEDDIHENNSNPRKVNKRRDKNIAKHVPENTNKGSEKQKIVKGGHGKNIYKNKELDTSNLAEDCGLRDISPEQDLPIIDQVSLRNEDNVHQTASNSKHSNKKKIAKRKDKDIAGNVHENFLNAASPINKKQKQLIVQDRSNENLHKNNKQTKDSAHKENIFIPPSPTQHTAGHLNSLERSKRRDESFYEDDMHENVSKSKIANKKQKITKKKIGDRVHENGNLDKSHLAVSEESSKKNSSLHKSNPVTPKKDGFKRKKYSSAKPKKSDKNSNSDKLVRKSCRQRYPPLAKWRNERLLYRFDDGQIKILGIDKGTREDFAPIKIKKNKQVKRKSKLKVKKVHIYDSVSKKKVSLNLYKTYASVPWDTPSTTTEDNPYRIKRAFQTKNSSFGFIEIDGLETKPTQYMPEEDLQMTVMKGHIEVLIQETLFEVREKDMFFVPRAAAYSLKNISTSKALLSFVVGRFKFIENGM